MTIQLQKASVVLLLVLLTTLLFMKVWDKGIEVDSSEREKALTSRIERLQQAEQYALLALKNGYYPCSHCLKKWVWLNKDEVAKYGVSINSESRYTDEFLKENSVYYFMQYTGTLQGCLEEEAKKIYLYYSLPENMIREKSLARPPLNKIDR